MTLSISDVREKIDYAFVHSGVYFKELILMTINSEYFLYRVEHPPSPIFIGPVEGMQVNIQEILFLCDYFSYEHEIPATYRNYRSDNSSPVKPLIPIKSNDFIDNDSWYYDNSLQLIYENLVNIKYNGLVLFKWEEAYHECINVEISESLLNAKKEIQLYSMALKQIDPLSDFLCYYRIIESVSGNNGKEWIKNHINLINFYDFGELKLIDALELNYSFDFETGTQNLFSIFREKANTRISNLKKSLNSTPIEKYLYNEIRCGIAHGKTGTKVYDNASNLTEIAEDNYIMKLLSRVAIETKPT